MMEVSAFLTSAGINTAVCLVLILLYSLLKKQPCFVSVYFGQQLSQVQSKCNEPIGLDRLIPSTSWIVKSWRTSEEEIFAAGGLDAVVFVRMIVLSIRIFFIAAVICVFLVLPLNYFGNAMEHKNIKSEKMDIFTILNVEKGSRWLWAHCLALYIISCSSCFLLYFEYRRITKMRLEHITKSPLSLSLFAILVRGIPRSSDKSYSASVKHFFAKYYASSYLSHQMIYRSGTVQRLMFDAEKMCKKLKTCSKEPQCGSSFPTRVLCGVPENSCEAICSDSDTGENRNNFDDECSAALVFLKTRYAASTASLSLQSTDPMLWVVDLAPEPDDLYWKNLFVPYRLLWIRRIATLMASAVFMFFFLFVVTFVQGLVHLDRLEKTFPFMKGILKRQFVRQVITGYLPSVVLLIFLYTVPPIMLLFSTVEGAISRSGRKKSTCLKVLYFLIWNIFVINILSGTAIDSGIVQLDLISDPKDIPYILARALPAAATFFMTYVLTSGWAGLACELIQPLGLLWIVFGRFIAKNDDVTYGPFTFPYHTEIPRVLLFGLLGFSCSIFAPLILPLLLVFLGLAFLIYQNQIINVYVTKYQSGGLYWPIMHNTTIFSLLLTQVLALGVFGLRESSIASSFTIPLIIGTLLFNEYCRQKFSPVFKKIPTTILIDMDCQDEHSEQMEEIHKRLLSAYTSPSYKPPKMPSKLFENGGDRPQNRKDVKSGKKPAEIQGLWAEPVKLQIEVQEMK